MLDQFLGRKDEPVDPLAEQRRQLEVIDNPLTDKIERENLTQAYLEQFAPGTRLRDFLPSPDMTRDIYRKCSPTDSRDPSAVALADQQRTRYARLYPSLFERPAAAQPQSAPSIDLDPAAARHSLRLHLDRMRAVNTRIGRLLEPSSQAGEAAARVRLAEKALADIEQRERDEWQAWLADTSTEKPAPLTARAQTLVELETARQQHAAAQAAADAARPPYLEAIQELQRLTEGRDPLIAAVLGTELPRLLAEKHQADLRMNRLTGALDEIRRELNRLGADTGAAFEAATSAPREQSHARCRAICDGSRLRVKQWVEALAADAGAELDIPEEM